MCFISARGQPLPRKPWNSGPLPFILFCVSSPSGFKCLCGPSPWKLDKTKGGRPVNKVLLFLSLVVLNLCGIVAPTAMAQDVGCWIFEKDTSGDLGTFPIGNANAAASGQVKGLWLTSPTGVSFPFTGTYIAGKSFTANSLRQLTVVAQFSYVRTSTECIHQSGPEPCGPRGAPCNSCITGSYSVYQYGSYVTYCNDGATAGKPGTQVNVACSFEGLGAGSGYLRGATDNGAGSLTGHICAMSTGCLEYTGQLAASYSKQEVSVPVPNGTAIKYTFSEALPDAKGVERVRFFKATNAAFLSPFLFCMLSGGDGGSTGGGTGGGKGGQDSCPMACTLGSCVGDTGCRGVTTGPDASCTRCMCSSDGQQPACNAGGNTGAGNNGGNSGMTGYSPGSGGSGKSSGRKLSD
jgi:hypothetical protein